MVAKVAETGCCDCGQVAGLAAAGAVLMLPGQALAERYGASKFRITNVMWDHKKRQMTAQGRKERKKIVKVVNAYVTCRADGFSCGG